MGQNVFRLLGYFSKKFFLRTLLCGIYDLSQIKWELRCGPQDRRWLLWVESWIGVPNLLHVPHPHPQAMMENMYAGEQIVLPS